ncbi:MAG: hypothetical protein II689_00805 [Firmicutes bacterium]|nr:hypothetical protein [Bacillota bacterium]
MKNDTESSKKLRKRGAGEAVICLAVFVALMACLAVPMGLANMLNTMMNTAYSILMDTCLYIMAIAVMTGAMGGLFSEFGIIELLNRMLSPLMKPLYGMPGASALGIVTTFLSDNPAILALAEDRRFRRYFKAYQIPALTNLGTAFGMGLIVTSGMLALASDHSVSLIGPVLIGVLGAVCGSIVSTRLMLIASKKRFGTELSALEMKGADKLKEKVEETDDKDDSLLTRVMSALLDGGKTGVDLGLKIIPGACIVCTLIMMLTYGPSASGEYTGAAFEGVRVFSWIGEKLSFILTPMFGFSNSGCISIPLTALGSSGAALGIIRSMSSMGLLSPNDISVFVAMCMCWSGYLSTHVSMMDILECRDLAGKSIAFHTIGGLVAGVVAHVVYTILF